MTVQCHTANKWEKPGSVSNSNYLTPKPMFLIALLWFSALCEHQNPLGNFKKHSSVGLVCLDSELAWVGAQEFRWGSLQLGLALIQGIFWDLVKMKIPMESGWAGAWGSSCLPSCQVTPLLLGLVIKLSRQCSAQLGLTPQRWTCNINQIFSPGPRVSQIVFSDHMLLSYLAICLKCRKWIEFLRASLNPG